ncbi:MAG: SMP-30/gluconolactonase/LRE family protein [Verrucomicrobiota bacterium]|nr:SMP-30/gluconolactonase/LRE family protein [Verrucomicrobiota bacterium]
MTPEISIDAFEIFANGLDHPECLAFDRHGDLWAGGEAGQIYRISPDGKVQLVTTLDSFCAGLAFSLEDELFVCNPALGIVRVTVGGEFSVFASHVGKHKIACANYGLFDSSGNYYVTDSGQWKKSNGYLLRFRPDGKGEILAGPLGYANGLALTVDEKNLFMVESNTDSVFRFEIRADGLVSAPEIYATDCGRFPDGLTLDAEGNLYVCCYASDEIWRISPSRKKIYSLGIATRFSSAVRQTWLLAEKILTNFILRISRELQLPAQKSDAKGSRSLTKKRQKN